MGGCMAWLGRLRMRIFWSTERLQHDLEMRIEQRERDIKGYENQLDLKGETIKKLYTLPNDKKIQLQREQAQSDYRRIVRTLKKEYISLDTLKGSLQNIREGLGTRRTVEEHRKVQVLAKKNDVSASQMKKLNDEYDRLIKERDSVTVTEQKTQKKELEMKHVETDHDVKMDVISGDDLSDLAILQSLGIRPVVRSDPPSAKETEEEEEDGEEEGDEEEESSEDDAAQHNRKLLVQVQ